MNAYRGFNIVKANHGSHRWHAELDGTHVEFRRGKVSDSSGTPCAYEGAYFTRLRDLKAAIDAYRAMESGVQRFESRYDRDPIEVSPECPTVAIRWILGRMHVGTPDAEIEAEIRRRVTEKTDPRWTPEKLDEAVRFALWEHAENRALCQAFRL